MTSEACTAEYLLYPFPWVSETVLFLLKIKPVADDKHFQKSIRVKQYLRRTKGLKMPMVKDLVSVYDNATDKEIWLSL